MKVTITDDDQLITMSLQMILGADEEIDVVGCSNDYDTTLSLYKVHHPDVVLLDIRMEPVNGIDMAKEILAIDPAAKILFLTTFLDDEYIIEALHIGAKGYILKQDYDTILPALKAIASGQNVYGNEIVEKIPNLLTSPTKTFSYSEYDISEKELEVIEQVANGLSNKEIANVLCLSEGTVRNYLSSILDKLDLRDRTQLAIFYYKHKK